MPPGESSDAQIDLQAQRILTITRELFPPGLLELEIQVDPNEPENEYLVIDVTAAGDRRQILEREAQWHHDVVRIIPGDSSWLRLCVYPQ